MLIEKTLSIKTIFEFTGFHVWWLTGWMLLVASIYYFNNGAIITLPWLPISLIGTAVAFYVGFKNSHSYSRLWSAAEIWGDIRNNSRRLVTMLKHYRSEEPNAEDGAAIRKQIIFRHIAYLYQLREQLLEPMPWEHVNLKTIEQEGNINRRRRAKINNWYKAELEGIAKRNYISDEEKNSLQPYSNKAARLLDIQSGCIQLLYKNKTVNMIQQIELQGTINRFYDNQGNVERIKQTPFPRKYASFSFVFVCIFIFLLPFAIIGEFSKIGNAGVWLSVPVGVIVGWVYVVMEMIGDYSENPFEGLHNDTPMLAICREIEINILQMTGETNIPLPIQMRGNVLI